MKTTTLNLYIANFNSRDLAVKRFQGQFEPTPGGFLDTFIPVGSGVAICWGRAHPAAGEIAQVSPPA